jgi:hypothetical protein
MSNASELALAQRFLEGIRERDGARLGGCLAEDALLRVLTPRSLREEPSRDAIVSRYERWLALDDFELLATDAEVVADRVRVRYRFRGQDPVKGWQENDHTAYLAIENGAIVALNIACAGFRPVRAPR